MAKILVGHGYEIEATCRKWSKHGKNWLYVNFDGGGKICLDLDTGEIIKRQSHCAPVLCPGERERLWAEYK